MVGVAVSGTGVMVARARVGEARGMGTEAVILVEIVATACVCKAPTSGVGEAMGLLVAGRLQATRRKGSRSKK